MRSFLLRSGLAALLVALAVVTAASCSNESSGTGGSAGVGGAPPDGACFQNPLGCEDGTTCAFDDADGSAMSCLPAGTKKAGDACTNTAGTPECGEKLVCLQLSGNDGGVCTRFCSGVSDCSGGDECAKITTAGAQHFYACADVK